MICSPGLPLDFMSAATVLVNHVCGTVSTMKKRMICADKLTPVVSPGCKLWRRISGHCQPLRMQAEESDHISNTQLNQTGFIVGQMLDSGFNVLMLYSCSGSKGGTEAWDFKLKCI